jgi:stage III sporulation protein AB
MMGYILSRDCSRRPQELRILQVLLQMFENEISFLSNLIAEAFTRLYNSSRSPVTVFFRLTVDKMGANNGLNASQAWELAVHEGAKKTALNKEDESILASFGKMLGNSDVDGQIKNIRLTLGQLKIQEQKAEESRAKTEKMYKSLGVLGGLAVVVILI